MAATNLYEIYMTPAEAEKIDSSNVRLIYWKFKGILQHRIRLYEQYDKEPMVVDAMLNPATATVFTPIARYATDIAAGYFIGKPCKYYSRVNTTVRSVEMLNGAKKSILERRSTGSLVDKTDEQRDAEDKEIDAYLSVYRAVLRRNHEDEENMELARMTLIHRTAFERIYVVKDPTDGHADIRFKAVDAKKAIVIRDKSVERDIVAFINREEFADPITGESVTQYELITAQRHVFFQFRNDATGGGDVTAGQEQPPSQPALLTYNADEESINLLKLVGIPIIEYPMPENKGFFEDVIPLMNARDAMLNNLRNTFKYNDEAILLMIGYMKPSSEAETEKIRAEVDKFKMLFLGEDNKVEWLLKNIPIESISGYYEILTNDIFAMLGVKNPVRTAEAYQNITTVRYQNYGMDNTVLGMERTFERGLLEGRARIITAILNYLNKTAWDWEKLDVAFDRNLPSSRVEEAQFITQMKGADIISDQDILDQVQFVEDSNAAVERKRMQDERETEELARATAGALGNTFADEKDEKPSKKGAAASGKEELEHGDGRVQSGR